MLKGKSNLSKKNYEVRGEGQADTHEDTSGFSLAESSPKKVRKAVGSVKDSGSGRVAHTQHSHYNLTQTFEEAARQRAAGEL